MKINYKDWHTPLQKNAKYDELYILPDQKTRENILERQLADVNFMISYANRLPAIHLKK